MLNKPRVVYWNNIPAPYMIERFNAVMRRGGLDFEVWFTERDRVDRSWKIDEAHWQFPYHYIKGNKFIKISSIMHLARKPIPDLLVTFYGTPLSYVGWFTVHVRGTRTAFWCQASSSSDWGSTRFWKEFLKRYALQHVDATFSSGEDGRRFAINYGMSDDRAMLLPHTIDVAHYRNGSRISNKERRLLRNELGLAGTVYLYVGRLWNGKGLTYLLDAFQRVQNQYNGDVSLLLLGDGEEEIALKKKNEDQGLINVVFAGFKQKAVIPRYYGISDVFVFPTLGDPYGLVIDEAMACSLPIISSSSAGEILDRVEDDINGWVVPPRDSEALAQHMLTLARKPEMRKKFGKSSYDKVKTRTSEQWAEKFEGLVYEVLSMPKR